MRWYEFALKRLEFHYLKMKAHHAVAKLTHVSFHDIQAYNWVQEIVQCLRAVDLADYPNILRKLHALAAISRYWTMGIMTNDKIKVLIDLMSKFQAPAVTKPWHEYALGQVRYFLTEAKSKCQLGHSAAASVTDELKAFMWLHQLKTAFDDIESNGYKFLSEKLDELYRLATQLPKSRTKMLLAEIRILLRCKMPSG
ncbi:TPA: hypothetical protein DF272_01650 [Candidatus Falkowbacteria bacterium]|nr:hypothetical protein [Candidatus Falkowbacteria bacterium]